MQNESRIDVIINNCKYLNQDFTVTTYGLTTILITPDREYVFNGDYNKGGHIISKFKEEVKKYIQSPNYSSTTHRYYTTQLFNPKNLKKDTELLCIDIDDCYWDTCRKLGIISQKTWIECLYDDDWKLTRNICIGLLKAKKHITRYKGHNVISNEENELIPGGEPIYNKILNTVWDTFDYIIFDILKDDFAMFYTDAVFMLMSSTKENQVYDYLKSVGYQYKIKAHTSYGFYDDGAVLPYTSSIFEYEWLLQDGVEEHVAAEKTRIRRTYNMYSQSNLISNFKR